MEAWGSLKMEAWGSLKMGAWASLCKAMPERNHSVVLFLEEAVMTRRKGFPTGLWVGRIHFEVCSLHKHGTRYLPRLCARTHTGYAWMQPHVKSELWSRA